MYVGGMSTEGRDESAEKQIVLGTGALASEGMNIKTLDCIALVTPKSRIEQAVGRIFRQKKEERKFNPIIFDILDVHDVLQGQYRKRIAFYKQCAYTIKIKEPGSDTYKETKRYKGQEEQALPAGPLFRT
jgi:superfamily II DNA or RNA helicase